MKIKYLVFGFISMMFSLASCNKNPKVITATQNQESEVGGTGIFSQDSPGPIPATQEIDGDIHSVRVLEALPTKKYVYIRVSEGTEEFWIATLKREVGIGKSYYYHGGLLKTNFESKEYNRIFEKLYLVSALVEADHADASPLNSSPQPSAAATENSKADAAVTIASLVANPKKYVGQRVQITGTCVKINPNIMGRNWVHLHDGTQDDFDLVVTCNVMIPEGHKVTMVGTVALDRDFGAGYTYEILLEGGEVVM